MKYTFKCPQCQQTEEEELTIAEYAEFKAVCERCKVKMERVYEMPQVGGGDSESTEESSTSSCAGSCTSCAGCGI
jgi:hypothetical protein